MGQTGVGQLRTATVEDVTELLPLWALLFDEQDADPGQVWWGNARRWFGEVVSDQRVACLPVVVADDAVVATAVGTLELGVPNPHCPRGRTVRLANVVTHPRHRGRGYGTLLVEHVVAWAASIDADRVDLSATPEGRRIYERAGFVLTSAPRMKLTL
ncbi:GNAT family N-acetyltransferase [Terrabacter sp. NPDC080008]|uniref:GNAT family N-acetyltransferase n=1 Tax=Terrabacter sp. NPDC080008 TaxID=3155176 RepID=UPI00344DD413